MDYKEKFEDFLDKMQGLLDNAKKQGHIIVRVEDLENAFPEPMESDDENKPNGGIVMEDFNDGNGFYKVNLAYLNEKQVEEIEELVKKWNPELKESEDELTWLTKYIEEEAYSLSMDIRDNEDRIKLKKLQKALAWLEKQGDKDKLIKELGEYKVKYIQEVLKKYINSMSNKDDERLRKTTIAFLKDFAEQGYENAVECIDWLEKQGKIDEDLIVKKFLINKGYPIDANGTFPTYEELYNIIREGLEEQGEQSEQKPADKVESKFKVGNWVVTDKNNTVQIKAINTGYYSIDNGMDFNMAYVDKCWHLWTIQDAKKGDILADKYGVYIYDQLDIFDESACVSICGYQYSDKKFEPESMICNKSDFYPATKEQRDLLFQKMQEADYEWDAEKKELKKIELPDVGHEYYSELLKNDKSDNIADYAYQCAYCMSHDWIEENATWDDVQKACRLGAKWQKKHDVSEDWSEKDENTIKVLMNIIRKSEIIDSIIYTDSLKEKLYDWLKSLRPHNAWKPSKEQMKALADALSLAKNCGEEYAFDLRTLFEQLEKLREE